MNEKIIDITGNTYNFLTVIGFDHCEKIAGKNRTFWKCKCKCGNIKVLRKDAFIYPYSRVKSCGCWHKKESSLRKKDEKTGRYVKNKERSF